MAKSDELLNPLAKVVNAGGALIFYSAIGYLATFFPARQQRILRLPEVKAKTGFGRSTIYAPIYISGLIA